MKDFYDVLIIGAGPAGCACALSLHKNGLQVGIVDKETFPRDKVCGDAIPGPTFKQMDKIDVEWGKALRNFADKADVRTSRMYAPNGNSFAVDWKEYSFNSKRIHFDHFLMNLVHNETDANILENKRLKELEVHGDYVLCKFHDNTLCKATVVVGCDGANSVVKRYVVQKKKLKSFHCAAVKVYASNVSDLEKATNEFFYLKNYLPGYLWVFPLPNGEANIGFGMELKEKEGFEKSINLRKTLLHIIENEPILSSRLTNVKFEEEIKGFSLPMFTEQRKISSDRILLCGDAASLIDPLMGHGIDKAFISGYLAAQQILRSNVTNDYSAKYLIQYDQSVYSSLGNELKRSKYLLRLVNRTPSLINLFAKIARNKKLLQWLVKVAKI